MKHQAYSVTGKLEVFETTAAPWIYLFIPFKKVPDVDPRGWGSIPVRATLGETTWDTSIFPLRKEGYFLPIKKLVRKNEDISAGSTVTVNYETTRTQVW